MKNSQIITTFLLLFVLSCKKIELTSPEDNEQITTIKLKFTEQGTSLENVFVVIDPDGDGPKPISKLDKIVLNPNKNYDFSIEILDETKNPVESISDVIEIEKEEHLFIYTSNPASLLVFKITDKDDKNLPVGLKATVKTGSAGTGTLKVQLRHQPGVKDGTPIPGSDDINQDFQVEIK